MDSKKQALSIFNAAIEEVKPEALIKKQIKRAGQMLLVKDRTFDLTEYRRIIVVGAGKASAYMAKALEELLVDRLSDGLVIVKYEHGADCRRIRIQEAGHPVTDNNGMEATADLLGLLERTTERDLVICLISGGGSALLEKLPQGISLNDLQQTTNSLLACGADIAEINTIRKHISLVKGGQLARAIAPADCLTLIVSDVIGDPLESIASGPTAPDSKTFNDALDVIDKYGLQESIPQPVFEYLREGSNGKHPETLKPEDATFFRVFNVILGNNRLALKAAAEEARKQGLSPEIITDTMHGEARKMAHNIITELKKRQEQRSGKEPLCLIYGGETTVTIKGKGKGGRNQELVLAALKEMQTIDYDFTLLSAGTDGTDGPTDAAGAVVNQGIIRKTREQKLNAQAYLDNNDAYHFFEKVDALIKTGPTGTNVMDIIIVLLK